jgi:phytoene synthase
VAKDAAELYSLCRLLDDIADGDINGLDAKEGTHRLRHIRRQLTQIDAGKIPEQPDPALLQYMQVMKRCQIPVMPLIHLLDGLLLDQSAMLLRDEEDLVAYAYHVAGAVGLLMCPVLGCDDRTAFRFAVDMGIGMQLTNIARDILEDAHMGRRYLPESWTGQLSPNQIVACAKAPESQNYKQIQAAADRLLTLADQYYESGRLGLGFLPVRARYGIAVAAGVYRAIGTKLRVRKLRWGDGRVVTSKSEKLSASLQALSKLYRLPKATHNSNLHEPLTGLLDEALK